MSKMDLESEVHLIMTATLSQDGRIITPARGMCIPREEASAYGTRDLSLPDV